MGHEDQLLESQYFGLQAGCLKRLGQKKRQIDGTRAQLLGKRLHGAALKFESHPRIGFLEFHQHPLDIVGGDSLGDPNGQRAPQLLLALDFRIGLLMESQKPS